jgi:radical SAM protein with 4Fe4S-binding SPASM domain
LESSKASLWKGNPPLLSTLDLELTERCNNNCIHCYINLPADDSDSAARELSTEQVKNILDEAALLGCLSVTFTGGEPLLRKDFEELYVFARRLGLRVLLFTNATLITPELARLFAEMPPLEPVEITVYGMKRSSYESISRKAGSYNSHRRGMELLQEHKIPFLVKTALLPANREEMAEFRNWASTIPWMDMPPTYTVFLDLRCRRDKDERNELIKQLRPEPAEIPEIFSQNKIEYQKEMREFCSNFIGPPGESLFSCGAGVNRVSVDAYGTCQTCALLRHPGTVYDLKTGSLKDCLTNFFSEIREIKAVDPDYLTHCARCFLKGLCDQCPGKSWLEHGTLDTPVEYFCEIAHVLARRLGLLKAREMGWEITDWRRRIKNFIGRDSDATEGLQFPGTRQFREV